MYLNDDLLCAGFLNAKRTELVYLLNCYYTLKELAAFYSPIYRYSKSFRYFVMQNYMKVKDVEAFAQMGGYSTPTFRRLFKETFGEPAYQWMLKRNVKTSERLNHYRNVYFRDQLQIRFRIAFQLFPLLPDQFRHVSPVHFATRKRNNQ